MNWLVLVLLQIGGFVVASEPVDPSTAPKKKKSRSVRPPENEGTKAPNRFESDLFLKSKYHINGQQLEVDPD